MATESTREAEFTFRQEEPPAETLVAGFSSYGLAGLTAVDYLIDHLDLEQTGRVTTDTLPPITPFENGRPRHHTRIYSAAGLDLTVLVNELFVPLWAAEPFAKAILDWTVANDVDEITVLSGIPVPHGPEDHRVYYVATDDYRDHRLADTDIPPMGNGFLDGINASLTARGMESALRTGIFVTPVHAQVPDVEAAIRLLGIAEQVYGIEIDTSDLEAFAGEIQQYYQDLAQRLENVTQEQLPEDRMYM